MSRKVGPSSDSYIIVDKEKYPGEDILNTETLRTFYKIPDVEVLQLKQGKMWCRVYGKDASNKVPILLCIGGTGTSMFYKNFAIKMQTLSHRATNSRAKSFCKSFTRPLEVLRRP